VSPGSYTEVVVLTIYHSLAANSELVTLNGTSPAGIGLTFSPSSPVQLPATKAVNVTLILTASASTTPGNDTITVSAVSGANSQTASFTVRVVQYRVVMFRNTFIPSVLNVTAGSTVFWQNLDGPAGGCGSAPGVGVHSVVFTTISGANSSTIKQFGIYSYMFTTPGSYFYYSSLDTDHIMNGTINVLATGGGGAGMVSRMPDFSYFKGGDPAAVTTTKTTATTSATRPVGPYAAASPIAAGGLAAAGLLALGVVSSALSGLGGSVGVAVLVGLVGLALALAMSDGGKRRMTALGLAIVSWVSASDSR